jgi:hypothetical protein
MGLVERRACECRKLFGNCMWMFGIDEIASTVAHRADQALT